MTEYPCITLWQPWAQWVALGWKTIETRTHGRFSGLVGERVAIHAGQRWDRSAVVGARKWLSREQRRILREMEEEFPQLSGKVLCTVHVKDGRPLTKADERAALIECATLRQGLFLADVRRLAEPIPARGRQGIWRVRLADDAFLQL